MHRRARHFNANQAGAHRVLDARFITGLANNAEVLTWNDRNAKGGIQGSTGTVPLYKTAGINGNPSVQITATNQRLSASIWPGATAAYTIFSVIDTLGSSVNNTICFMVSNAGGSRVFSLIEFTTSGGAGFYSNTASGGTFYLAAAWSPSNRVFWSTFTRGSGSSATSTATAAGYTNSATTQTNNTSTSFGLGNFLGDASLNGYGCVIIFDAVVSAPLKRRIEDSICFSWKTFS